MEFNQEKAAKKGPQKWHELIRKKGPFSIHESRSSSIKYKFLGVDIDLEIVKLAQSIVIVMMMKKKSNLSFLKKVESNYNHS